MKYYLGIAMKCKEPLRDAAEHCSEAIGGRVTSSKLIEVLVTNYLPLLKKRYEEAAKKMKEGGIL